VIIWTNRELKEHYDELKAGDCFIGLLSFKKVKHRVLIDLLERGVRLFPSALSQTLGHSKVAQALVFRKWMVPHTLAVARKVDLMHAINTYNQHGIGTVVTKEDHLQCGFGVHRWDSIEAVYNHVSFNTYSYPFVLQPFLELYTDVRVIIAGDYYEAYTRENQNNFRMNLTAGGTSRPYTLTKAQLSLCHSVMERGKFPYAHIDLLVTEDGHCYLSEIALNGGMKGARIKREELDAIKKDLLEKMANGKTPK
jgi:glutathione synthase/RimK-type ligase-like ATP-grasp enzyme